MNYMTIRAIALSLFMVFVQAVPSFAAQPVPRVIVGLYNGKMFPLQEESVLHRFAELPLNHLGLKLEMYDINEGLPDLSDRPDVRGVMSWFREPQVMRDMVPYMRWVREAITKHRKKFIIMEYPGFIPEDRAHPKLFAEANKTLALLGVEHIRCPKESLKEQKENESENKIYACGLVKDTEQVEFPIHDKEMVGFERQLGRHKFAYHFYKLRDKAAKLYLSARIDGKSATDSALVLTHPNGAFAVGEYAATAVYDELRERDHRFWVVNPFKFFANVFATDDLPKPDTTTLAGRRIYFSHIDGDGWNTPSKIPDYKRYSFYQQDVTSAKVLIQDLIAPYADLPVTVAMIAADIDKEWLGTSYGRKLAKEMYKLPQVEAASHTYSHPFAWEFYEHYTKEREKPYLTRFWQGHWGDRDIKPMPEDYKYELEEYYMPRAYANEPFDLNKEVYGAKKTIESVSGGKQVSMVMWSGDCLPFAEAMRATDASGMLNINGGDSRFDSIFPSYSWLAPIGREINGHYQIYSANSNENTYTDGWQPPYNGFNLLRQTWDNTEFPIRVKPMNLYYHVFSAEYEAGFNAVKDNLDYARTQPITPIKASEYARIARGFYDAEFIPDGEQRWQINKRGALQTIRFDDADAKAVDFNRSQGVVGQLHYQGGLYVYLDKVSENAVVALTSRDKAQNKALYLLESRWPVWGVEAKGNNGVSFTAQGYGSGKMRWKAPKSGAYRVSAQGGAIQMVQTNARGELAFTVPGDAFEPRQIDIRAEK